MISKSAFGGLVLAFFVFTLTHDLLRAQSFCREAAGSITAVATVVPPSGLTLVLDENELTRTACAEYLESADMSAPGGGPVFGLVRAGRSQSVQITVQAGGALIFRSLTGQSAVNSKILPGPAVDLALLDLGTIIRTVESSNSSFIVTLAAIDQ